MHALADQRQRSQGTMIKSDEPDRGASLDLVSPRSLEP